MSAAVTTATPPQIHPDVDEEPLRFHIVTDPPFDAVSPALMSALDFCFDLDAPTVFPSSFPDTGGREGYAIASLMAPNALTQKQQLSDDSDSKTNSV